MKRQRGGDLVESISKTPSQQEAPIAHSRRRSLLLAAAVLFLLTSCSRAIAGNAQGANVPLGELLLPPSQLPTGYSYTAIAPEHIQPNVGIGALLGAAIDPPNCADATPGIPGVTGKPDAPLAMFSATAGMRALSVALSTAPLDIQAITKRVAACTQMSVVFADLRGTVKLVSTDSGIKGALAVEIITTLEPEDPSAPSNIPPSASYVVYAEQGGHSLVATYTDAGSTVGPADPVAAVEARRGELFDVVRRQLTILGG